MQISIYSLSNISGCYHLLAIHDTLWLIIYNFAIAFTFPCTFVLFECIISVRIVQTKRDWDRDGDRDRDGDKEIELIEIHFGNVLVPNDGIQPYGGRETVS